MSQSLGGFCQELYKYEAHGNVVCFLQFILLCTDRFFRKDEFDKRDKGLDALISALFRAIRTSYIVKSTKLKAKLLSKQNVVVKTIIPSKKENVFWEYRF